MKTCTQTSFLRRLLKLALLTAGAASALAAEEVVTVSSFGFDPVDSTEILQKALDSGARKIVIDKQASPWITRPLFGRSDCEIVFERGTEVVAKKGAFLGKGDSLLTLKCARNVKISGYGATLRMCDAATVSTNALQREIQSYVWDEKARLRGEERPLKERDHAMDALRYLCHTRTNRFRRLPE